MTVRGTTTRISVAVLVANDVASIGVAEPGISKRTLRSAGTLPALLVLGASGLEYVNRSPVRTTSVPLVVNSTAPT